MSLELMNNIINNQSSFETPVSSNDISLKLLEEFKKLSKKEKKSFLNNNEFLRLVKGSAIFGSFDLIKELVKSNIFFRKNKHEQLVFEYIDQFKKEKMSQWAIDLYFNGPTYENIKEFFNLDKTNPLREFYANTTGFPYEYTFKNRELYYDILKALVKSAEKNVEQKNIVLSYLPTLRIDTIKIIIDELKKAVPNFDLSSYYISPFIENIDKRTSKNPLKAVFFKSLMLYCDFDMKISFSIEDILDELSNLEQDKNNALRISKLGLKYSGKTNYYNVGYVFNRWIDKENISINDCEKFSNIINESCTDIKEYLREVDIYLNFKIMQSDIVKKEENVVLKPRKF